ncbi:MAG: DNA starvation/stationary phase protection protein Dps [Gemmatimonadetes bacterium]|nr:DNA starvation/stationary phase protection protein Dps [Gemmatimonadota bacterium]
MPRTIAQRTPSRVADAPTETVRLFATKLDLPVPMRIQVIDLLMPRLADALDLQSQAKQAHWNVKGPSFIALHRLFDEVATAAGLYADLIAERIVQLGGVAEGTVRMVAPRTELNDYPATLDTGSEHVAALSDVLAQFGHGTRTGIEELELLGDKAGADILTEVTRGTDQWLWFVEAHQQHVPVTS